MDRACGASDVFMNGTEGTHARQRRGHGRTIDIALHQVTLEPLQSTQVGKIEGGIGMELCAAPKRARIEFGASPRNPHRVNSGAVRGPF
jgi:hypothetical protein